MQSASDSHPSTADRISLVSDFHAGQQNDIVDLFQAALLVRGLPALSQQFVVPNVSPSFDDVRTFPIASNSEFFGLFPAAWRYLEHQLDNRTAPWIAAESTLLEIESTVNDLAEKSLRNYEIKVRWNNVTSP